jgi:hypothetical protein
MFYDHFFFIHDDRNNKLYGFSQASFSKQGKGLTLTLTLSLGLTLKASIMLERLANCKYFIIFDHLFSHEVKQFIILISNANILYIFFVTDGREK